MTITCFRIANKNSYLFIVYISLLPNVPELLYKYPLKLYSIELFGNIKDLSSIKAAMRDIKHMSLIVINICTITCGYHMSHKQKEAYHKF